MRGRCPRPLDERGFGDDRIIEIGICQVAFRNRGKSQFAGVPGLEPRLNEPESLVLPITPYPIDSLLLTAATLEKFML